MQRGPGVGRVVGAAVLWGKTWKNIQMYDKCMILHDYRYPEVEIEYGLLKSLSISYLFPYGTLWINVGIMVETPKR
jgi:hypothetical protein